MQLYSLSAFSFRLSAFSSILVGNLLIEQMNSPYFIGIDVGTQGARAVLINSTGEVLGSGEQAFPLNNQSREEQSPAQWWQDCLLCLQQVIAQVKSHIRLSDVQAISVTSTSGTIIPLDRNNNPLHNAIMYSDPRSARADGRSGDHILLAPPYNVTDDELEMIVDLLGQTLDAVLPS